MHKYVLYTQSSKSAFEWDLKKELMNIKKHGVNFKQATEVFVDPNAIFLKDIVHSNTEDRLFVVGKDFANNIITVRYTVRNQGIRIFGAAKWRKWRKYYEQNT